MWHQSVSQEFVCAAPARLQGAALSRLGVNVALYRHALLERSKGASGHGNGGKTTHWHLHSLQRSLFIHHSRHTVHAKADESELYLISPLLHHAWGKCWEHISAFWGLIDDMTLQTPPSPKDTNIPCPRKTNHHPLHDCFFMDSTACTPLVTPRWLIMVCILQKKKSHFCAVPVFSEVLNEFFRVKVWFVYKYDGYI